MTRYAIGVGSNVGDRLAHLRYAVEGMRSLGTVDAISSLYETAPVGGPEQDPFLNAVVVVESELDPPRLLRELHEIEARAGRVRDVKWGPRTLDLDVLATDLSPIDRPGLQVPHPRAAEREFVLAPLSEVWPEADVGGLTAEKAASQVVDQEVDRLFGDWVDDSRGRMGTLLVGVQLSWFGAIALALYLNGTVPSKIGLWQGVGTALASIGIALAVESSRRLGAGLTVLPEPSAAGVFVEAGPYSLARHPIYGGILLFMVGAGLVFASLWALLLSPGLAGLFLVKTDYEERHLRVRYPDYMAYRRRVRRRLIPFVL